MNFYKSIKTRIVMWIWNHTPTCAQMTRLASQSLEQPPSMKMRFKIRLHFLICAWCTRYFKQVDFLHRAAPGIEDHRNGLAGRGLTEDARQRMLQRLRSAENK